MNIKTENEQPTEEQLRQLEEAYKRLRQTKIACPKCNKMMSFADDSVYLTIPAQRDVICVCGYKARAREYPSKGFHL